MIHAMLWSIVIVACAPGKEPLKPVNNMPRHPEKLVIYQMMTRLFGNKSTTNKFYGTKDENGVGKFSDINDAALKGIRDLGVTDVWYTGVLEHASLTDYTAYGIPLDDADVVKGIAGSPYAIRDYYDVDPDLAVDVRARMREFEELVARTHDHGLRVIMDFVPNHVARVYHSDAKPADVKDLGEGDNVSVAFRRDNNFYYLPGQEFQPPRAGMEEKFTHPTKDGRFEEVPAKVTGNDEFTASPGRDSWYETVKLNYGIDIQNNRMTHFDPIPDTWVKMRDILSFWTNKGIDGFRCDMAEMVPVQFWAWVIPQIKEINPHIIFIAEIYNPSEYRNYLEAGKFDFLYDKVLLYDTLRSVVSRTGHLTEIDPIQKRLEGINNKMLHFMENHDEQRIASKFFAGDPWRGLPAFVVSATIDSGPIMIYFGQEVGEPGTGAEGFQSDDGRTTIFDYWGVAEHQKWMNGGRFDGGLLSAEQKRLRSVYATLLTFVKQSEAIYSGDYADLTGYNVSLSNFASSVHAFLRFSDRERLLIVNNFSSTEMDITIKIPDELLQRLGISDSDEYIATDVLGSTFEVAFAKDRTLPLHLPPHGSFIFKLTRKKT